MSNYQTFSNNLNLKKQEAELENAMASSAATVAAELCMMNTHQELVVSKWNCSLKMGHPQPVTPIETDNSVSKGIQR